MVNGCAAEVATNVSTSLSTGVNLTKYTTTSSTIELHNAESDHSVWLLDHT